MTASSSKGTCCSDIALNPCLCHPSYVFRHCYSSGSFRHPSNRCASSKLSCSTFSRPNVEFSAFPNSSICCKQSHEFTKAGAQCSLGVCAYPIRTRLLAVHLASSADSTPRSSTAIAHCGIFVSQPGWRTCRCSGSAQNRQHNRQVQSRQGALPGSLCGRHLSSHQAAHNPQCGLSQAPLIAHDPWSCCRCQQHVHAQKVRVGVSRRAGCLRSQ